MWRNGWRVFPMFVVVSVCRERSVLSIYMHGEIDISLRYVLVETPRTIHAHTFTDLTPGTLGTGPEDVV